MSRFKQFCLWSLFLILVCSSFTEAEYRPEIRRLDYYTSDALTIKGVTVDDSAIYTGFVLTYDGDNIVYSAAGVIDHGALTGLADDDHTQYILEDGTRAFSGNQSHGDNNITNVGSIDLVIIRADATNGSITVELDNAAGADFLIGSSINPRTLVVEGDNNRVGIGTVAPDAQFQVTNLVAGDVAAIIRAASGQSETLLRFQDSGGGYMSAFTEDGYFRVGGTATGGRERINIKAFSQDLTSEGLDILSFTGGTSTTSGSRALAGIRGSVKSGTSDGGTHTGSITGGIFQASASTSGGSTTTAITGGVFTALFNTDDVVNLARGGNFQTSGQGARTASITTAQAGFFKNIAMATAINTAYGIFVDEATVGTGSIKNNYGIWLDQQTVGSSNNFQIFSNGGAIEFNAGTSAIDVLTIDGAASQSGSLLRLRDSSGNNYITTGDGLTGSEFRGNDQNVDIDFVWEGSTDTELLHVDAGLNGVCIGGTAPDSLFEADGAIGLAIETVTGDTVLDKTYSTVLVNASGNVTITLPPAASSYNNTDGIGRIYEIKKIDADADTVTVDGNGSETIDGAITAVITTQYESITIQSNGTSYFIL